MFRRPDYPKLSRRKRIITGLILIPIMLFLFSEIIEVEAQIPEVPSPPNIQINQSYAFRNVLELNDILFIAAYIIENDSGASGTWDGFLSTAALSKVINPDGTVIAQKSLDRLGGGIFGYYFNAVDAAANFTFGTDVTLRIDSNPTTFSNIVTTVNQGTLCGNPTVICAGEKVGTGTTDDWINTTTIAQTKSQMETRFVQMAESIESEYRDNTPEEFLVEGGRINATGANIFIEAFIGAIQVAPDAFAVGDELLSIAFNPGTFQFETSLNTDTASSRPRLALESLSDSFSLNRTLTSLAIVFGLTIPLYMGLREASRSDALAMTSIAGMLVWWTSLFFIAPALLFSLGLILWALLGVWIWRTIPTN